MWAELLTLANALIKLSPFTDYVPNSGSHRIRQTSDSYILLSNNKTSKKSDGRSEGNPRILICSELKNSLLILQSILPCRILRQGSIVLRHLGEGLTPSACLDHIQHFLLIRTPHILTVWQAFHLVQSISFGVIYAADQNYSYTSSVMTKLLKVARLQFLIVGIALFVFGALWAVILGSDFSPVRLLFGYMIILPAQLSVHFSNDYFDLASDTPSNRTLISGGGGVLLEHPELRKPAIWTAVILIFVSIGMGAAFTWRFSYPIWVMGIVLLGNLAGWFYSAPPISFSQRGFGEICYTLISGFLIPGMGYLAVRGTFDMEGLVFTIPLTLYGLVSILSVEIPDMEDDLLSSKKTWVALKGRNFAYTIIGWLLLMATIYFFIYPVFDDSQVPVDFRILGGLSFLPLAAGVFGLLRRPAKRDLAIQLAIWIVVLLAVFSVLVDIYLFYLAGKWKM